MGPRPRGAPALAAPSARGPCRWSLRWSSMWGREPCEGCADMGGGLGLRWSSLWGRDPREGCAKMGGGARVRTLPLGPS
eukprot:1475127-Pyramimonas_sp.AAC.1